MGTHQQTPKDTASVSLEAEGSSEKQLHIGEPPVPVPNHKSVGCGFIGENVVLGVVYDPAADGGSLRFYVNDKCVWSSARHKPFAFQTGVAATQCYPFVESFGVSFRAELVEGWRPPACDDH